MAAEITHLTIVDGKIVEGKVETVQPEGINGSELGLYNFIPGLGFERRHSGKLLVRADATKLSAYTENWVAGTIILDKEEDGSVSKIDPVWARGVELRVIQTEIWARDVGIRIRHLG